MKLRYGKSGVLLLAVLFSVFFAACSENNTIYPEVQTTLVVTFDPNPAPITDYGEYRTVMCVVNVSGIGAYIHGVLLQPYSPAGEPYLEETFDENWFKRGFAANLASGAYIPAGDGRCTTYTQSSMRRDAYGDWTFFGEDEQGNAVSGTGRLYYGAVY